METITNCYCCSDKPFVECCKPYLTGIKPAPNCEALMRSRYTAYCLADTAYLLATLHPSEHFSGLAQEVANFARSAHFCHLRINASSENTEHGQVSFVAYYIQGQKLDVIEEISDFIYEQRWYYKSGILKKNEPTKIGRNDPCPCGSGKKFKQCSAHQPSGSTTDKYFL